ncbi:uncharacterized protein LOC120844061 [Ixodes scapularis]|uniref:uncharacterized protein LOC120844061 n=1 Tax=Ixodes scapularis TaxID=6945 RepID=UPI001A9FEA16|nr:uncharacterized protein LOC120844061 [Ixodes scapularis]
MSFINANFEGFKTVVKEMQTKIVTLKREQLRTRNACTDLYKQLSETRKELIELKQNRRLSNIEIKGVPLPPTESLHEIIVNIGEKLSTKIASQDIDAIHRVPTKHKTKSNIIVRFFAPTVRDDVLQAGKKQRLNAAALGFQTNEPIYINEHLCVENKTLLGKALQLKREQNWKFTWTSRGGILMRKVENSKVIKNTCDDDLVQIVQCPPPPPLLLYNKLIL